MLERVTYPPTCILLSSPANFATPVPNVVIARPVTFWFARSVTVMNEKSAPAIAPTANDASMARTMATNGLALSPTAVSYTFGAMRPKIPPMYMIPSTPRLRFPDFSVRISPIVQNMSDVP